MLSWIVCLSLLEQVPNKVRKNRFEAFWGYDILVLICVPLPIPHSTWAENLSLGAQQLVLLLLMWNFTSDPSAASKCNIATVVVLQLGFLACSMVLPKRLWPLLLGFTGVLALVSNVAQIMLTYDTADLGQLSWATTLLRLAGCLVRMFTTFVLASEDTTLLLLFAMVFGLNAIQAAQLVIYR